MATTIKIIQMIVEEDVAAGVGVTGAGEGAGGTTGTGTGTICGGRTGRIDGSDK